MTIDYKQAMALIESMIGWEDVGTEASKPKSPHCRTHLEAILGVSFANSINTWSDKVDRNSIEKLEPLCDYIQNAMIILKAQIKLLQQNDD